MKSDTCHRICPPLPYERQRALARNTNEHVAASRVRTAAGLFYFGRVRRSDWLPTEITDDQQTERGYESRDSDESVDSNETDGNGFDSDEPLSDSEEERERRAKRGFFYDESDEDEGFEYEDEEDYTSLFEAEEGEERETFDAAFDSCDE